jgi:L-erythro-3,5-diaminohexanoate dehydrogenase
MERLGVHRSLDPRGALPQQARRLDTTSPVGPDEIAIEVEYLNVDSASWRQIREATDGSARAIAARVLDIVRERGKMHNPVTGSGGMLVGRVAELGSHRTEPAVGSRIATLVSLTLTPLVIDEITAIDPALERVGVKGRAILFGSGIYTLVPEDLDDAVVLGVLDVCGAPAWAARLARRGMSVVVIGAGGKSGMLTCAQAVRSVGGRGRVLGLCWPEDTVVAAKEAGAEALAVDCTNAMAVMSSVTEAFSGEMADLVFVCANVAGCEGGAILACKDDGRVEGLGKSCELTIGNGFVPGHADLALDLVRSSPQLLARFGS